MNEIAQLTYNQSDFVEIMEMIDKRLNDKGKNWRHVFKVKIVRTIQSPSSLTNITHQALTVLDYCLHAGSENVVLYFRDNIYIIKTLKEFQFIDEDMKDQGANVRQKAKDISNLLSDEARLREQRRDRAHMRDRMVGKPNGADDDFENENVRRRSRSAPAGEAGGSGRKRRDEDELKRAIEASKRSLADEQARMGEMTAEYVLAHIDLFKHLIFVSRERDLAAALRLSKEEEERRQKSIDDSNARSLFDEGTQLAPVASSSNPFPLVDIGSMSQNQAHLQPQFTAFNPYFQQQQMQAQQQAEAQAQYDWMAQQQALQQQQQQAQQQQQQAMLQAQQEEWMRQQQYAQQAQFQHQQTLFASPPIQAQPTGYGSNNPFAISTAPTPASEQRHPANGLFDGMGNTGSSLAPPSNSHAPSAQLGGPSSRSSSPTMVNTMANARRPVNANADSQHAQLATFLANRLVICYSCF